MAKLDRKKWITKGFDFVTDSDGDLCISKNKKKLKLPDGSLTKYLRMELKRKGYLQ